MKSLSSLRYMLLILIITACDNTNSANYRTLSAANSCFMTTGIMTFQDGIPTSGITLEHFNCVKNLADNGDTEAQWLLVNFYKRGIFVKQSPVMSTYWIRKLAESGDITAKSLLATAYYNGEGVQKNIGKSIEIFSELYKNGNLTNPSIYNYILLTSDNPQKNWPIAKAILEEGLANNDDWAYQYLPLIYLNDFYFPQDIPLAINLFEEGIERGLTHFNVWLGLIHLSGTGVPISYDKAQKYFNQTNFVGIYNIFIEDLNSDDFSASRYQIYAQDPTASLRRGMLFEKEKDYRQAFEAYQIAAKSQNYFAYKRIEELINNKLVIAPNIDLQSFSFAMKDTKKIFIDEIIQTQSLILFLKAFANKKDPIALQLLEHYEQDIKVIRD